MSQRRNEVTFRFLAEPSDVNFGGKVHGGMVMKWIDQAGYAAAASWSGKYCVTVSVNGVQFIRPILIGNLVTVSAKLAYTGRSSMHFIVDVFARDMLTEHEHLATSCVIVFVALDAPNGKSCEITPWQAQNEQDKKSRDYVLKIAQLSNAMQELIEKQQPAIKKH